MSSRNEIFAVILRTEMYKEIEIKIKPFEVEKQFNLLYWMRLRNIENSFSDIKFGHTIMWENTRESGIFIKKIERRKY